MKKYTFTSEKRPERRWYAFNITRAARQGDILFTRFTLLATPWFAIRFHRFHRSDSACLHDHPWPFISFILWNGYYEETPTPLALDPRHTLSKFYGPGSILRRPAKFRHRVVLKTVERLVEGGHPLEYETVTLKPITLVITGPRQREWGFWTLDGWMPWNKAGDRIDEC